MESGSTAPRYRCSTCELSASTRPRNLVVFIDGTSNKPGDKNTNVVKLYDNVMAARGEDSELEQRKYYLKGIGAYDVDHLSCLEWAGNAVYSGFEKLLAWSAGENVKNAYSWLAETYREGDRIYLFGFSRGAYQVRALASMIHEVGLVREKRDSETAYNHYLAIDPYEPRSRRNATEFKRLFCWQDVRIHFVGVWDTVSSLGLVKRNVHVTESASVTNACHFRHALALDERRVKFMPEYFLEMNAHHSTGSPRSTISDVKEVWFAGSHSDVGGTERPLHGPPLADSEGDGLGPYAVHAGNVPLVWIQREAADKGLVFKAKEFTWDPGDVEFGTRNSMSWIWNFFEILPVRHQVSFSGTGKHKWRCHLFRPRSIIPRQQVHTSVFAANAYTPRATLTHGVGIPTASAMAPEELWTVELADEEATTRLLSLLLRDQRVALEFVEKTLFLLDSRLGRGQNQSIPQPQWSKEDIPMQSDFARFALTVIYDATCNFTASEDLVISARASLSTVLSTPDHPDFYRTMYTLRFSTRHETLRQRFIDHDEVIGALVHALEWAAKSASGNLFLFVTDILCDLICANGPRDKVVDQLSAISNATDPAKSRFSAALGVKSPNQLAASLKMIASLAQIEPGACEALKPYIRELAEKERCPVGSAAVEALVALREPLSCNVHISNILGYISHVLPRLDAEGGGVSSTDNVDDLPFVLRVNGSGPLDAEVMGKLVLSIQSRKAHERTAATLTLLKLCGNSDIHMACSRLKVLDVFMGQLEQKGTSLLAAYALRVCLRHNMWTSGDFPRVAQSVVGMLERGWFDDAVGWVEGCGIFRGLMGSAELRRQVREFGLVDILVKKLEGGKRHQVRMSLSCLEILGSEDPLELALIVADNVNRLMDKDKKVQKKGVKVLAGLARTSAGARAIEPQVIDIVKMLLPPVDGPPPRRAQLFGPAAAVYDLCKNENLRNQIQGSTEYREILRFAHAQHSGRPR